ncbi:hypothetical protein Tco_0685848 [Tanacetum coccineum]
MQRLSLHFNLSPKDLLPHDADSQEHIFQSLVQGIVHQCLQQDDMHNGITGFIRNYIDTRPNGDALRKCILKGPYTPTIVTTPVVPATENSPAVPEQTTVETVMNMTPENRAHFESEKEAIHLILTGIGDEIYSTVDACQTAQEMWEAIERLQQGESLNIQDVKTNLFWEFGQFTSHDGETIESYYTRFYNVVLKSYG